MRNWQLNGAALGWLIDPYTKVVQVYEAGKDAWVFTGKELAGTGPMAGFTLNLLEVWRCYEV
jgi:Uma2 family endonuclease